MPTPTVSPVAPPAASARAAPHARATTSISSANGAERVPGDEVVDVRQRRDDPALHRLVARLAAVRVDPDHPVGQPAQPPHLLAEQRRASPRSQPSLKITTTAPRATPRCPQRSRNALSASPEPGAAGPVRAPARRPPRSARSGSRCAQRPGDPGQPGADVNTSTRARPARRRDLGVGEPQQRVGVRRHRAGDVDEQHHPPRPGAARGGSRSGPGSPTRRSSSRRVRRASSSPRRAGRRRRDRRRGSRTSSAASSRRIWARSAAVEVGDVAVPQHLGRAGRGPQRSASSSSSAARCRRRLVGAAAATGDGAAALVRVRRAGAGQLAVEPGGEDLVVAGEVVGVAHSVARPAQ